MQGNELIRRIKQYYGVSDIDLATECDVTREHINRVLHGHKRANAELLEKLESILEYCREVQYQPTRKPYTRHVVSNKEPVQSKPLVDRPKAIQPARRETLPDRPKAVQVSKHACQSCQINKGTAFYQVWGGWYCGTCAKQWGQLPIG